MAATTAPICFSRDETYIQCTESAASSTERFFRRGSWNQRGVLELKQWPGKRDSRTFHLATSRRNFFQIVSRTFPSICGGRSRTSSVVSIDTATCFSEVVAYLFYWFDRVASFVITFTESGFWQIEENIKSPSRILNIVKKWRTVHVIAVASVLTCIFLVVPSAEAVDALKTCACLLKECRVELAKCVANPSCAANIACLQTCNNRPDETECQIKCGDLFENNVVDEFNECAVSRKKCVPQKSDVGDFPIPDPASLVKSFNIGDFSGKWYITSGLNPTFDAFDCQLHEFHTEANKLVGNLSWRIRTPDSGFITRSAVQRFVQDPSQPGILYNHDNEFLHYQDDWYILSSKIENKPEDYVVVYYRGKNDAWDGYGGAVVYTRSAVLPDSIIPELEKAAKNVGRDFNKFIRTDNTCGPEPPLVERLEKTVEEGERTIVREVEEIEEEVEKTEMTLFQRLVEGLKELKQDEEYFLKELSEEEKEILGGLKMEASEAEKLFRRALPLRKLR